MPYSSGILDQRVSIQNRSTATTSDFGKKDGAYVTAATVWASVTWSKGSKAMREGALDAYDVIMVRMRYNTICQRDSRIVHDGKTYQIESMHADQRANTIQLTASELSQ